MDSTVSSVFQGAHAALSSLHRRCGEKCAGGVCVGVQTPGALHRSPRLPPHLSCGHSLYVLMLSECCLPHSKVLLLSWGCQAVLAAGRVPPCSCHPQLPYLLPQTLVTPRRLPLAWPPQDRRSTFSGADFASDAVSASCSVLY